MESVLLVLLHVTLDLALNSTVKNKSQHCTDYVQQYIHNSKNNV